MRLQVICRGTVKGGLGHLFRTRTFVKAAHPAHTVEVIAIVEPCLANILSELSCPVHVVQTDEQVVPYVEMFAADVVLFDTITLERTVFERIKPIPRLTASLSPIFDRMEQIDLLFTRLPSPPTSPGVQVFGGLAYAIFNDYGTVIDDHTYERNLMRADLPIAVCMGGTDAANKTLAVLKALVQSNIPATFWVMLGEGYAHSYNDLVGVVRNNTRHEVVLAKTNRSLWHIMSNCVLAVLAGGLTTIEALYAGLPTINLYERPEHFDMMNPLFQMGVCLDGGSFSNQSLTTMVQTIEHLSLHRALLQDIRTRGKGCLDQKGSERVLAVLQSQIDTVLGR